MRGSAKPPRRVAVYWTPSSNAVAGVSGTYFGDRKPIPAPAQADDPAANAALWRISAGLAGLEAGGG